MPKNIVIFSDGTGQAGGINFDEARTNVYKLYRACRVGPDTKVEPSEQVAFYDPGLGSASDGGHFKIGWMRWLYNLASMATGLGVTRNIVDCYAAIISLYEEGDRIYLIGFSRGAYSTRPSLRRSTVDLRRCCHVGENAGSRGSDNGLPCLRFQDRHRRSELATMSHGTTSSGSSSPRGSCADAEKTING